VGAYTWTDGMVYLGGIFWNEEPHIRVDYRKDAHGEGGRHGGPVMPRDLSSLALL
jgi:hypothetical protein